MLNVSVDKRHCQSDNIDFKGKVRNWCREHFSIPRSHVNVIHMPTTPLVVCCGRQIMLTLPSEVWRFLQGLCL